MMLCRVLETISPTFNRWDHIGLAAMNGKPKLNGVGMGGFGHQRRQVKE